MFEKETDTDTDADTDADKDTDTETHTPTDTDTDTDTHISIHTYVAGLIRHHDSICCTAHVSCREHALAEHMLVLLQLASFKSTFFTTLHMLWCIIFEFHYCA